jgi:hypothetical protein
MHNHDRQVLADRLERASRRLAEIGPRVRAGRGDGREWTEHEVLAHIATLSKYYGVLIHKVASGQMTEVNLLDAAQLRDAAIDHMAQQPPADVLRTALADHGRTIKTLRTTTAGSLRRNVPVGGEATMTAEELARLPLISHLEMHINQLEKMLGRQ